MTGTTETTKNRRNKYAADCRNCGCRVGPGEGALEMRGGRWVVICSDCEALGTSYNRSRSDTKEAGYMAAAGWEY